MRSQYINRWGVYKSVRVLSEICTVGCMLTAVCIFIGYFSEGGTPSPTMNAVVNDAVITGLLNLVIQLTDNYMFWYRYMAVIPKIPLIKKIAVHSWVAFVLCPWFITDFPMPLFVDVNTDFYVSINNVFNQMVAYGQIAFNLYFSYEFGLILYQLKYDPHCKYSEAARRIAIKTLLHCLIRSVLFLILNCCYL
jgi:hypothetical protein